MNTAKWNPCDALRALEQAQAKADREGHEPNVIIDELVAGGRRALANRWIEDNYVVSKLPASYMRYAR